MTTPDQGLIPALGEVFTARRSDVTNIISACMVIAARHMRAKGVCEAGFVEAARRIWRVEAGKELAPPQVLN